MFRLRSTHLATSSPLQCRACLQWTATRHVSSGLVLCEFCYPSRVRCDSCDLKFPQADLVCCNEYGPDEELVSTSKPLCRSCNYEMNLDFYELHGKVCSQCDFPQSDYMCQACRKKGALFCIHLPPNFVCSSCLADQVMYTNRENIPVSNTR